MRLFGSLMSQRDADRTELIRLDQSPRAGIHDVSYWLGHTNVATTSRYLKTTAKRLQRVARALDEGRSIANRLPNEKPPIRKSESAVKFS
jgi:integrase